VLAGEDWLASRYYVEGDLLYSRLKWVQVFLVGQGVSTFRLFLYGMLLEESIEEIDDGCPSPLLAMQFRSTKAIDLVSL
jgi:hypothetical protein